MRCFFLLLVVIVPASLKAEDFPPRREPPFRTEVPRLPRLASATEVKAILEELALPALPLGPEPGPRPHLLFAGDALKPYASDATIEEILQDVEKYKFRAAVLQTLQAIRDTSLTADPKAPKPITRIPGPLTDETKKQVFNTQEAIALGIARLELVSVTLTDVENLRAKETRRWQAHYDYTLGQLRLRIAMLNEYNKLLGDVRAERLPELTEGASGWQLVPAEEIQSKKDVRKLVEDAMAGFKALATDHKGTPWELLARRDLLTQPGLKWEVVGK
jgi:hypothetical protein